MCIFTRMHGCAFSVKHESRMRGCAFSLKHPKSLWLNEKSASPFECQGESAPTPGENLGPPESVAIFFSFFSPKKSVIQTSPRFRWGCPPPRLSPRQTGGGAIRPTCLYIEPCPAPPPTHSVHWPRPPRPKTIKVPRRRQPPPFLRPTSVVCERFLFYGSAAIPELPVALCCHNVGALPKEGIAFSVCKQHSRVGFVIYWNAFVSTNFSTRTSFV